MLGEDVVDLHNSDSDAVRDNAADAERECCC